MFSLFYIKVQTVCRYLDSEEFYATLCVPPKSQKGPSDEIVKDLKWCKTNVVVVVGMTI